MGNMAENLVLGSIVARTIWTKLVIHKIDMNINSPFAVLLIFSKTISFLGWTIVRTESSGVRTKQWSDRGYARFCNSFGNISWIENSKSRFKTRITNSSQIRITLLSDFSSSDHVIIHPRSYYLCPIPLLI